jgi:superfamily II DNA/RNA helicase
MFASHHHAGPIPLLRTLMTKFSDLALDPRVLQAITDAGYETPTPIQAEAIPHALEGRDVLGIAQTGTGKTASFTLPMITRLGRGRARARMPRSLVLAPTRELAAQVAENFDTYAKHTKLTKALLIGGVSFGEQDKLIDRGVDVLIATPGRLLDHFERGKLLLTGVEIMVVDEADRMLDMGFIPDIERIFQLTPFTRQTLFFSATMAPEIERITKTFLTNPAKIEVARQNSTSATIEQQLIQFTPSRKDRSFTEKRAVLRSLIKREGEGCTNAIIFCNRKMDVDVVAKSLKAHGFNAAAIHGDLDQSQRMKTLDSFRDGTLHLLVASDVAARGLDIPAVSHVFNFDVPSHPEDYVHRIGRTGRAGRLGKAFTIAVPADEKYLANIQSLVKQDIPRGQVPEGALEGLGDASDRPRGERKDEKRGRSRDRDRDRKPKRDESMPPASMEPLAAATIEVAAPQPAPAPREERRDDRRGDRRDRRDDRRDDRQAAPERREERASDERRGERRDDRRDRRDDRRDHHQVVGMGDHVPDFILRSFKIASVTSEDAEPEMAATGSEG